MASGPITSWQINGETVETVTDFIFFVSKISWWLQAWNRWVLLGSKVMTNLGSILRSRDITLPTQVHLVKAMFFSVVMYVCECWTIRKAEHRNTDAFELWCWRLLRVPWTARRSNQFILREISPESSLERLMLKLKLQYFGQLMPRTDSFESTLMLGKIEGWRRSGWQRMRRLDGITNGHEYESTLGVSDEQGSLACCSPWCHMESDMVTDWTELNVSYSICLNL